MAERNSSARSDSRMDARRQTAPSVFLGCAKTGGGRVVAKSPQSRKANSPSPAAPSSSRTSTRCLSRSRFYEGAGDRLLHPHRPVLLPTSRTGPSRSSAIRRVDGFFFYEKQCPSHRPGWSGRRPCEPAPRREADRLLHDERLPRSSGGESRRPGAAHLSASRRRHHTAHCARFDLDPGRPPTSCSLPVGLC